MQQNLTLTQRVSLAETDLRDHAKTIGAYTEQLRSTEDRVTTLERQEQARQIEESARKVRDEALLAAVTSIQTLGSRVQWLVISSIILAFLAFTIGGGLKIG